MGRFLAIDYGTKRVGLAVTDPMKIIATSLETIHSKDLIEYLENYFKSEEVEKIVLGLPKRLNNEDTHSSAIVRDVQKHLTRKFPDKPVVFVDERFTSKMALQTMIDGGTSKKNRREKGNLDKISAVIILQSYLEQIAL